MVSRNYTLLIVESPTIAKIIRGFYIPYLEVLATGGFCWKPVFDSTKNKLKLKADPEKRSIRRTLKEKSGWASKIVIATDEDAAGDFIAYSLQHFLKKVSPLYRTPITALDKTSIEDQIAKAVPCSDQSYTRLKNRFLISRVLDQHTKKNLGKYPWTKLALLSYFFDQHPRTYFRDSENNFYKSSSSINLDLTSKFSIDSDIHQKIAIPDFPSPWTTVEMLTNLFTKSDHRSYTSLQKDLNTLFTTLPEELENGLITYPRTSAQGFFEDTWDQLLSNWLKHYPLESFRPRNIWDMVPENEAHESIRPLHLHLSPMDIRPFFRKKYFDWYQLIYRHHINVLQKPEMVQTRYIKYGDLNIFPLDENHFSSGSNNFKDHLKPVSKVANVFQFLYRMEAARPSQSGKIMDHLQKNQWIEVQKQWIFPKREAFEFQSRIKSVYSITKLVQLLKKDIGEQQLDYKMVNEQIYDL